MTKGGFLLQERDDTAAPLANGMGPGYRVAPRNWKPRADDSAWLTPGPRGAVPGPSIVFDPPVRHRFRIGLELGAAGMRVLRLRFRSKRPAGMRWRDVLVSVDQPGAVHHALDRVALGVAGGGRLRLEVEGALMEEEVLQGIALDPTDDWFDEVGASPDMALRVDHVSVLPVGIQSGRRDESYRAVRFDDDPPPDRGRRTGTRDAVVFAWWIPDTVAGHSVGANALGLLRCRHADSRIFVGVNHGSDPVWLDRLQESGLDVDVRTVPPEIAVASDVGGFLAALEGFHQSPESFDLVWFGHTKGASRNQSNYYHAVRFNLEQRFWARRTEIERIFEHPRIGLLAPRYSLTPTYPFPGPWRGWLEELAALKRIYRDRYPPLGLTALDTFFVMRSDIVRAFCDAVAPWFFRTDPGEYGASRWFFEMAFPSIAAMQGYEPFIAMDVPGDNDPRDDIMLERDIKQTHRLAMAELDRWRADPAGFRPRRLPWDRKAWQAPA